MPGLGNFIGEFLVLLGAFKANITITVISSFGLIFASVYSLWVIQKVFHGEYRNIDFDDSHLYDLNQRELIYFGLMMVGLIWMGMYPQSFLDLSQGALEGILASSQIVATAAVTK